MSVIHRGMVLEIEKNKAILLTSDGNFLEQDFQGKPPEIGSEIIIKKAKRNRTLYYLATIAAILALIISPLLFLQPAFLNPTYAYVSIDINPSLELSINQKNIVLEAKPLNTDAELLLKDLYLKGKNLENAIKLITERAIKDAYIRPEKDNAVIIAYCQQNGQIIEYNKKKELKQKITDVLIEQNQIAVVEILDVQKDIRKEANKLGISSGKYSLFKEAKNEGINIPVESLKEEGMLNIIKKAGGNPNKIISTLTGNKNTKTENRASNLTTKEKLQKNENKGFDSKKPQQNNNLKKNKEEKLDKVSDKKENILRSNIIDNKDKEIGKEIEQEANKEQEIIQKQKINKEQNSENDNGNSSEKNQKNRAKKGKSQNKNK